MAMAMALLLLLPAIAAAVWDFFFIAAGFRDDVGRRSAPPLPEERDSIAGGEARRKRAL
jgi:hypothetical protein